MQFQRVNQNGGELFVRAFANVRDKPPTLPDGDLTGDRTVSESRRGTGYRHLVTGQHSGTEITSMRRRGERVERVSVHFKPPSLPHEEHSPAGAEQSGGRSFGPCWAVRWSVRGSSTGHGVTKIKDRQAPKTDVPLPARLSCCREDHWLERARTF